MKHKIKHTKVDQNTAETVARLIQIIDRELARGEDADEALILECTEYLQELSPETAVPAKVTEKYLQAELNRPNGGMHITHRRSHHRILKVALRLAAVIVALAIFCVAIPVAAVHLSVDGTVAKPFDKLLRPVLALTSLNTDTSDLAYPEASRFVKEENYCATYQSTEELLKEEIPPNILCLSDLPESFGTYDIILDYFGEMESVRWRISWISDKGAWKYQVSYVNAQFPEMARWIYQNYDRYTVNGRIFFYRQNSDKSYDAVYIQDKLKYTLRVSDFDSLTVLLDHAIPAEDIIPSATVTTPEHEIIPLISPEQYQPNSEGETFNTTQKRVASYTTTKGFLVGKGINILVIPDETETIDPFWIEVAHHKDGVQWSVYWYDMNERWSFAAHYLGEDQEFRRAEYEAAYKMVEQYAVGERTYYIIATTTDSGTKYLVNYFEGNITYSLNVDDRETLESILNSLVKADELVAQQQ